MLLNLSVNSTFLYFFIFVAFISGCVSAPVDRYSAYNTASLPEFRPILKIDSGVHQSAVRKLLFTSDGRLISVSDDKTIKVWDSSSGQLIRVLAGQIGDGDSGKLYSAALTADDRLLAVGGDIGNRAARQSFIRLIDFDSGEIASLLKGHTNVVLSLAFSTKGGYLASGSADGTARLWDYRTGRALHILKPEGMGRNDFIYTAAFSPEGDKLITGHSDGSLTLWQTESGQQIARMTGHADQVMSAVFTADGKFIISGSLDKTIRMWDSNGDFLKVLATQNRAIDSLSISADNLLLSGFSAGQGEMVCDVLQVPDGRKIASFSRHTNSVLATVLTSDGTMAATAGGGGNEIYLWDTHDARVKNKIIGKGNTVWSVGFGSDGRSISWGNKWSKENIFSYGFLSKTLQLKKMVRGKESVWLAVSQKADDMSYDRAIKSAGPWSITTENKKISPYLYVMRNGQQHVTLTRGATDGYKHLSASLSRDGKIVFSGAMNGVLTSYDSMSGQKIHDFVGHTGAVWSLAVSPDNRWLLSGSADQTIRLWDIAAGRELMAFFCTDDNEWVAWTPSGFYNASPNGDNFIGWHLNRGDKKMAEYYTAKQLRRFLYRPDMVENGLMPLKTYDDKYKSRDISVAELIEKAPAHISLAVTEVDKTGIANLIVKLGSNKTSSPERIAVYVNGSQILAEPERQLHGVVAGSKLKYRIDLPEKENHVRCMVENSWAESTAELSIVRPDSFAPVSQTKGTLFVNAIGINNYPNLPSDQQLTSPRADAAAIAERFSKLKNVLFDEVEIHVLTDTPNVLITSDMVEKFLHEQAAKAGPNDTTLIFLAGHGITDQRGDYHFVTAETTLGSALGNNIELEKGTSFDWTRLHKVLDSARGRRLVFVDTCQAGSVLEDDRIATQKLAKDIHDVNAIIFSGASRQQSAVETEFGGVFTQSILEGLGGKASYQQDKLRFSSLYRYVEKQVPYLNQQVVLRAMRGIKFVGADKDKALQTADKNHFQKPVAVVPKGMESLVIFKKKI